MMRKYYHTYSLFFLIILVFSSTTALSQQNNCPDFKIGSQPNLSGWIGKTGRKLPQTFGCQMQGAEIILSGMESTPSSTSNCCCNHIGSFDNTRDRFKVYTRTDGNNGYDPNVPCMQLPLVPNDDFLYSIRLGNTCGETEAEGLYYKMVVNANNALLFVHFAIVLEYLLDHDDSQNPEFIISVKDNTGKLIDPCAQLRVSSYGVEGKPGWHVCPISAANKNPIAVKEWTKVALNLLKYINQEVTIEILTGDCSFTAHYGYAYVALECAAARTYSEDCAPGGTDTVASATAAPLDGGTYKWEIRKNGKTYPTYSANNKQTLYVTEQDFDQIDKEDKDGTIDCVCTISSHMNPQIPCTAEQVIPLNNLKPRIVVEENILCNREAVFTNNSYVLSPSCRIDTTKTVWYIEDSVYHTHSQVSHKFATGGQKQVRISVENNTGKNCYNEHTFTYMIRDSLFLEIIPDKPFYCIGDVATFYADGANSYVWTIGDSIYEGDTIRHKLGPYDTSISIVGTKGFCTNTLTEAISVQPYPKLSVSGDTVVCLGESTNLTVSYDIDGSFIWSSSPSGNPVISEEPSCLITPSADSTFFIIVTTKNNCTSVDSLHVRVVSPIISADVSEICPGENVTLSVKSDLASDFVWRAVPEESELNPIDNNTTIIVSPLVSTEYFVKAIGLAPAFCSSDEVSFNISVYPYPIPEIYSRIPYIDEEEPAVMLADSSLYGVYSFWDFGDGSTSEERNPSHLYNPASLGKDSVIIGLTSFNKLRCESSTSKVLYIKKLQIRFPNAFLPGKGDIFKPLTENSFDRFHLTIYNRWGELIFESQDPNNGWDGTFKGKDAARGNYVWTLTFKLPEKERVYSQKGSILLIR